MGGSGEQGVMTLKASEPVGVRSGLVFLGSRPPERRGMKRKLKRGDILKLSKEGLDYLYGYKPNKREQAKEYRFEYRCPSRNTDACISVRKIGASYYTYQSYHKSFLESA